MAIYSKTIEGLTNGEEHFVKVFTVNHKGRVNNRVDLPFANAIPSEFPAEPSSYALIGTYSSSQTFTAPEDGWYQVELFGRSGAGGAGDYRQKFWNSSDNTIQGAAFVGGGGGGGGAYCCSNKIKLNKGDTVTIVISTICTVTITASTGDTYSVMQCTSGANGGKSTAALYKSSSTLGKGGAGGSASGGNYANKNGITGGAGKWHGVIGCGNLSEGDRILSTSSQTYSASGGAGGSAGYTGGRSGGKGGGNTVKGGANKITITAISAGSAQAGFCKIYRGDTNVVAS